MLKSLLKNTDYVVLVTVLLLFVIGVIAIFSAGYNTDVNKDEYIKQIMWMAAVFVMMIVIWAVDYKVFDIAGYILYGINLILLMLVLFMPSLMGASSWFNLGGILYQPSELMKIGFIICAAKLATIYKNNINQNDKKKKIIMIAVMLLTFLLPVILIMLQPDFGTGMIILVSIIGLLFVSGVDFKFFIRLGLIGVVGIVLLIAIAPYRLERILSFLNPWSDPLGSGFQIIQSLYAIGPGGLFGQGFMNSRQKHFYLPEPQTDFIFSIIREIYHLICRLIKYLRDQNWGKR